MKVYFAGQDNFGNRGCEALIRANVKTIRSVFPEASFLVPSRRIDLDSRQWPEAAALGVQFVDPEPFPGLIRWWGRARRALPSLAGIVPRYRVSAATRALIGQSDVLIMTGGDIISLDYGLESLHYWAGLCEAAMQAGKPAVLWAASVGPFSAHPATERQMRAFLARFALITVRETASFDYLQQLGLRNVQQVTDPAFALDAEAVPAALEGCFAGARPVLGFNISPLILKFRSSDEARAALEQEVAAFLSDVVEADGMDVLLIPHVDPLDGGEDNSDWAYMRRIRALLEPAQQSRVQLLPRGLNAAQLKGVIRRCTYFMGARTHATVAALSQGVPTTSIAYSVKAKGINQDLFGHTDYVLETPRVSRDSLGAHLAMLSKVREQITAELEKKSSVWRESAYGSAAALVALLEKREIQ
ncbi:MAG: hypothetical protein CGU28_13080 [Candidatus Dactylopiibacterium carminicum]|nr:MAG: hypothetical protein CGU28_13080 [Candidatus Dactylopiibacterium carminicum]